MSPSLNPHYEESVLPDVAAASAAPHLELVRADDMRLEEAVGVLAAALELEGGTQDQLLEKITDEIVALDEEKREQFIANFQELAVMLRDGDSMDEERPRGVLTLVADEDGGQPPSLDAASLVAELLVDSEEPGRGMHDGEEEEDAASKLLQTQRKPIDQKLVFQAQREEKGALESLWLQAQAVAAKVAGSSSLRFRVPWEDLTQICLTVVPGAVKRYDPSKGALFETYLARRMSGALQDEARAWQGANGLTRGDYSKLKEALKSDDPPASLHKLASEGLTYAQHLIVDGKVMSTAMSFDFFRYHADDDEAETREPPSREDTAAEALRNIEATELREMIRDLPVQQRVVLILRYGLTDEPPLTQPAIAALMKVTDSRVSQIETAGKKKLAHILSKTSSTSIGF